MTFPRNSILVRIDSDKVYLIPEKKFNPDIPYTTCRISGKLYYLFYRGVWRVAIDTPFPMWMPLATAETVETIEKLSKYDSKV